MNWYLKVLKQYADFSGRARRKEYWMFGLFNFIFSYVAMYLDNALGTTMSLHDNVYGDIQMFYGYLYILYVMFVFIPGLAVGVRRLHDVGKSGWMFLVILIPLVGVIWLLVLFLKDSQLEDNKWGRNPKEISA